MNKTVWALSIACIFLFLIISGCVLGEEGNTLRYNSQSQEEEQQQVPQPVNLNFYGGDGGELKVDTPEGNSSTSVPCPGSPTPRLMGLLVGIWTSPAITSTISADPRITAELWAKTNQNANNVHFNCQILKNGNQIIDIWTESQSLSNTPTKFSGEGSHSGPIELMAGDTIGTRVYYFADPQYGVGPAPDATLLVGSSEHDTHITLTTTPITMVIQEPAVSSHFTTITAQVTDAFSATRYQTKIIIDGITDAETLSTPTISPGGNGTMVTWNWDHKTDKAKDGEYKIVISISYTEDNEFTAMGVYELEFPKGDGDNGGLMGLGDWFMPVIIIVVLAIVIIVAVKIILGRRQTTSSS